MVHPTIQNSETKTSSGTDRSALLLNLLRQSRINFQRIGLEYLLLVRETENCRPIDVAPRVIKVVAGFGVDTLDGADHFRCEENVVRRNYFSHAIDTRLVIYTRVEVHVVKQKFFERRALHVLR